MTRHLVAVAAAALFLLAAAPAHAAVDLPPPTVTGTAGENGWFVGDVTVKWSPTGENSSSPGCVTQTLATDTAGTTITCTATDSGGGSVTRTVVIHLDKTPPAGLTATPARPPDAPPFYTAPVPIAWSATDATSKVAACTTTTYAGPDAPAVAPQGTCRDNAGNATPPLTYAFAYDATAPALTAVTAAAAADGRVALSWDAAADAQTISVTRDPGAATILDRAPAATTDAVADGPLAAATTYTYTVTARDAAGNATTATAAATTPAAATAKSAKATKNAGRPVLRWKARRGAKYYNVQLFRNGRKVLSAWPTTNRYTLRASWRFRGRTHRLASGRYRFYVWPGYGRRAERRYGRLVAKGTVAVPAKATARQR